MKVGKKKGLHVMPFRKCGFCENRHSKSLALLGDLNKIFSIPSSIYFRFAYSSSENMSTRSFLSENEFRENRCSERHTVHVGAKVFLSVLSTFVVRFGWNSVEEIRTWCCWDCDFHENRRKESHTVLTNINEITCLRTLLNRVIFRK
jgi:hypothetical protein